MLRGCLPACESHTAGVTRTRRTAGAGSFRELPDIDDIRLNERYPRGVVAGQSRTVSATKSPMSE